MKCDGCKWALWNRTKAGKLHPDKQGRCGRLEAYPLDLRVPAAFYWNTWRAGDVPAPSGGFIERGRELHTNCIFKDGSDAGESKGESK